MLCSQGSSVTDHGSPSKGRSVPIWFQYFPSGNFSRSRANFCFTASSAALVDWSLHFFQLNVAGIHIALLSVFIGNGIPKRKAFTSHVNRLPSGKYGKAGRCIRWLWKREGFPA